MLPSKSCIRCCERISRAMPELSMNVTPDELQAVVGQRGYFPADMPVKDYPMDFVDGCLVAAWDQVAQMIVNNRDVPF